MLRVISAATLVALATLAAAGCKDEEPAPNFDAEPRLPKEALTASWGVHERGNYPELTLTPEGGKEALDGSCYFVLVTDSKDELPRLSVDCKIDEMKDFLVEGFDQPATAEERRRWGLSSLYLQGPLLTRAGEMALSEFEKPRPVVPVNLPVTIELWGYAPLTVTIPPLEAQTRVFHHLGEEALLFEGEQAKGSDGALTALVMKPGGGLEVVGEGSTFADIDWIVLHENEASGQDKQCGVAGLGKFKMLGHDAKITVRERRTGEVVEEHRIEHTAADARCKDVFSLQRGQSTVDSTVPLAKTVAWAKRRVEQG